MYVGNFLAVVVYVFSSKEPMNLDSDFMDDPISPASKAGLVKQTTTTIANGRTARATVSSGWWGKVLCAIGIHAPGMEMLRDEEKEKEFPGLDGWWKIIISCKRCGKELR